MLFQRDERVAAAAGLFGRRHGGDVDRKDDVFCRGGFPRKPVVDVVAVGAEVEHAVAVLAADVQNFLPAFGEVVSADHIKIDPKLLSVLDGGLQAFAEISLRFFGRGFLFSAFAVPEQRKAVIAQIGPHRLEDGRVHVGHHGGDRLEKRASGVARFPADSLHEGLVENAAGKAVEKVYGVADAALRVPENLFERYGDSRAEGGAFHDVFKRHELHFPLKKIYMDSDAPQIDKLYEMYKFFTNIQVCLKPKKLWIRILRLFHAICQVYTFSPAAVMVYWICRRTKLCGGERRAERAYLEAFHSFSGLEP